MQYSIIQTSELDPIVFRLDAEYYHPSHIKLRSQLSRHELISIRNARGVLDCSAFYPSIVPYYNFESVGIPFVRVNEIQNGLLHLTKETAFLPQEILGENESTIATCKPNDLVIAKGGNSLAKVALLTDEYPQYSICRDVIALRTQNLRKLNRYYLWIFLHSSAGQQLLLRTASQTGQPHLTVESLCQLEVPVFSSVFQGRFESLYAKSQELKSSSAMLYEQAQSILLSELSLSSWQLKHQLCFVRNYSDTERAERVDAEYYQPKYDKIVAAIKNYPGGWNTLGNLVDIKKCVEVGSEEYLDQGIPFVRVSNLSPFEVTEEKYISESLYSELAQEDSETKSLSKLIRFRESKSHQPMQGEILFSKDATPGIAYYLRDEPPKMIPSGGILRLLRKNRQVNDDYLTLALNSILVKEQVSRDCGGSVILHWRPDQVKETLIPILSESRQAKIQVKVTESFSLHKQSKHLLECAKRAVEVAIEKGEKAAIKWLDGRKLLST